MVSLEKYSTRFGMTFGQILSFLSLLIILIGFIINSQVQNESTRAMVKEVDLKYQLKTDMLENGRETNAILIERNRTENRDEHQKLSDKLDRIYDVVKK